MASTVRGWRTYHAFLSFRGADIRHSFISHLYDRLTAKGIYTFKDDRKLPKGRSISLEITEAIRDSTLYVVVLSENYASSPWCLDELAEIAVQARRRERGASVVVPVFYNVDPSDVEEVRGNFGDAMARHAVSFGEETVRMWRDALSYVSGICGWDSRNREEADLISDIVRDVSDKVNCAFSSDSSDLVGIGAHVEKMLELLNADSDAVRFVGIWGLAGVGKSTIAGVTLDRLRSKFGACCFIADVGRKFAERNGGVALKRELLSTILNEEVLTGWPLHQGSKIIKERLSRRNVLIVLDNVDGLQQLRLLAKERNWFGPGSRIVVTTRDKDVLNTHGMDSLYLAEPLAEDAALQLFSRCAFKQNQPKDGYLKLSREFLNQSGHVPFVLEFLGSSLSNKSLADWEWELDKLRKVPHRQILDMLKVSIDGLDEMEKDVFLDTACFFNKMDRDKARDILDACGFLSERTFRVLTDKALIRILSNQLHMHELHVKLGQDIVRQENKQPRERSRWWDPSDTHHCLTKNMGSKNVQGIFLDMAKFEEMHLTGEAFTKMAGLRLLNFYHLQCDEPTCNVQLHGDRLGSISQELRYFRWDAFPAKVLPPDFCAKFLVELHMPHSKIEVLWERKQHLMNLKLIDLKHSNLTKLPDLSEAKKLEHLNLQNCKSLVDVSSIEHLNRIEYLDLHGCCNLFRLPSLACLEVLTTLDLTDCINLRELPTLPRNCKYVYLAGTKIEELPPSSKYFPRLVALDLRRCTTLTNLQDISEVECLEQVNVAGCTGLLQLLSENESLSGHSSEDTSINVVSNDVDNLVEGGKVLPEFCGKISQGECQDEERKWKNGPNWSYQPEYVILEEKKRKRVLVANEQNDSETKPPLEQTTWNSNVSFVTLPSASCNQKGVGVGVGAAAALQMQQMIKTSSMKVGYQLEDSSGFSNPVQNGLVPGGGVQCEQLKCQEPVNKETCSSQMQQASEEESINKALWGLKSILDQGPGKVEQNMGACKSTRQLVRHLVNDDRVSIENKKRLFEIEQTVSSVVTTSLAEKKSELTAEQNCATREIQELDKEIAEAEAMLESLKRSRDEAGQQCNSITTKLQLVNADLLYFTDSNLGGQQIMTEESGLPAL